jgi:hypothetical protein
VKLCFFMRQSPSMRPSTSSSETCDADGKVQGVFGGVGSAVPVGWRGAGSGVVSRATMWKFNGPGSLYSPFTSCWISGAYQSTNRFLGKLLIVTTSNTAGCHSRTIRNALNVPTGRLTFSKASTAQVYVTRSLVGSNGTFQVACPCPQLPTRRGHLNSIGGSIPVSKAPLFTRARTKSLVM